MVLISFYSKQSVANQQFAIANQTFFNKHTLSSKSNSLFKALYKKHPTVGMIPQFIRSQFQITFYWFKLGWLELKYTKAICK